MAITKVPAEDYMLRASVTPDKLEYFAGQVLDSKTAELRLKPIAVGIFSVILAEQNKGEPAFRIIDRVVNDWSPVDPDLTAVYQAEQPEDVDVSDMPRKLHLGGGLLRVHGDIVLADRESARCPVTAAGATVKLPEDLQSHTLTLGVGEDSSAAYVGDFTLRRLVVAGPPKPELKWPDPVAAV